MPRRWRPQWADHESFSWFSILCQYSPAPPGSLVAQRKQGNMLNEGRVAEVEQTGLQALYQRPWLELDLFPMFSEFDNCALRGQHAVAVLVAVHWVLEALPKVQT